MTNKDPPHGVQVIIDQLGFRWYQTRVIFFIGIIQATDTMETLIQAILGPTLRCEWKLKSDYIAYLTTLVFLGVCVGSPPIGYLSDLLGRKTLNLLCCTALIHSTWLCAISPNYIWLALLRFISGLYIGGLMTAGCSMIAEVLPETYQSTGQLLVCFFDSIMALFVTGLGFGCSVLNLSWRYFLLFSTTPLILCMIGLFYCIYESPVLLAHWGRKNEAAQVLNQIAIINDQSPNVSCFNSHLPGNKSLSFEDYLEKSDETNQNVNSISSFTNICKLIGQKYILSTLLLIFINFIWGMIIYGGTTLLPVELPSISRTCLQVCFFLIKKNII